MAPIVYEIDPDADTVIVLKSPCTSFAPWNPLTIEQQDKGVDPCVKQQIAHVEQPIKQQIADVDPPTYQSETNRFLGPSVAKKGKKKKVHRRPCVLVDITPPPLDVSDPIFVQPEEPVATSSQTTLFGNGAFGGVENSPVAKGINVAGNVSPTALALAENPAEPEDDEIRYHVSSRHLTLASTWFKNTLTNEGWNESFRNENDGRFYISAEDWDTEAFLIVLRIFHLRNKHVPRQVTVEMLAKIAVIVDYYNCGEALEVFTDMWTKHLRRSALPSLYCRDLVLWILVSWVFDLTDEFKQATAVAIKQSSESMRTLELPIPDQVSEELDFGRYKAIDSAVDGVYELLDRYRKADYVCPSDSGYSFECGSFLFGALTKELNRLDLLIPRPQPPFRGISLDKVCKQLRTMQSPRWSGPGSGDRGYYYRSGHNCTLGDAVVSVVSIVDAATKGLDIKTMKKGKGISTKEHFARK